MPVSELIYVGIKGAVVALDRKSGAIRWTRQLGVVEKGSHLSIGNSLFIRTDAAKDGLANTKMRPLFRTAQVRRSLFA